jgi:hypothetical protein
MGNLVADQSPGGSNPGYLIPAAGNSLGVFDQGTARKQLGQFVIGQPDEVIAKMQTMRKT